MARPIISASAPSPKRPRPNALVLEQLDHRRTNSHSNLFKIVTNDPRLGKRLRFNEMTLLPELWGKAITDSLLTTIRTTISDAYSVDRGDEELLRVLRAVAARTPHRPVQRYLRGLSWDGTKRIPVLHDQVLNCAAHNCTPVHSVAIRKWFIGAVARAMKPGCKMDTVLTLVGKQGVGKSTFFKILGSPWFVDTAISIGHKDAYLQLSASWIYEMPEGDGILLRTSQDKLKGFITSCEDVFRCPYGRSMERRARHNVLVATTNEAEFLKDTTGTRRYWVIQVGAIDLDRLRAWRDQLWAEAMHYYEAGEQWWLTTEDEQKLEQLTEEFRCFDPWQDMIPDILESLRWPNKLPSTALLEKLATKAHSGTHRRAAPIMRQLGYREKNGSLDGKKRRYWTRDSQVNGSTDPSSNSPGLANHCPARIR